MIIKRVTTQLASVLGYTVIPRWRLEHFDMARKLRELFAYYKIETVIDVGANEGQYRDFLRHEIGFDGLIESFEPIPELSQRLQARASSDPLWKIWPKALGSARGTATINVMAGSDFSSFLNPRKVGTQRQNEKNTVVQVVEVEVSTLDDELSSRQGLGQTYLKLDTQGFDLEVLKGARNVIAQIPLLQTEVSFRPYYENMPTYVESIAAFKGGGFAVSDLFLVTSDSKQRAVEFDCIMVRDA